MTWEKVRLGDIADSIQPGPFGSQLHSSDYSESGTPIIMPKDMINGRISHADLLYVGEDHVRRLKRHQVHEGNIMVARKGDVRKCVFITDNEDGWMTGSDCLKVALNEAVCFPKFIYYQLRSPFIGKWLETISIGATMPSLNTGLLSGIELVLPPYATQKRISDILSAYDDLIENNQKQIKLLEEAAQRLYKEWFIDLRFPGHESTPIVEGLPEEWKKQSIEDIADYLNGFAFKPEDWGTVGKPIIKIKEMNEGITKDTPRNTGESVPEKYNVTSGDILFSWSATLTAMIWDAEPGLLNQHLFKVLPHKGYSREFVLQSILNALEEFKNLTTGATMKHIQRGKLKEVFVLVPSSSIMVQYEKISEQIRQKILCLRNTSYLLSDSRERILPKIMDGTIKI